MNIDDILNVDMTPLSSISTSGPDMSVAMSVELDTSTAVEFGDRSREIQDTAVAMLELGDTTVGASRFRNPSIEWISLHCVQFLCHSVQNTQSLRC